VDGDGRSWNYTSGALDIVAHELTHGVTDYSSRLVYRNESGALNEAFSDVMAVGAEFFFQTPGSGPRRADYLLGEDVITPGGLRSLANPASFGDPDHYSKRFRGAADNGGVHTNSLIPGHAFYLAIEGGTNRTSGRTVRGVGQENRVEIERSFYRAFVDMLPSNATFRQARSATIAAATDLYGSGSPAVRAISQAWSAVGVE
jgi:thermolysin